MKAAIAILAMVAALFLPRFALAAVDHSLCRSECPVCDVAVPGACASCAVQCQPAVEAEAPAETPEGRAPWPDAPSTERLGLVHAPPEPPPRISLS